MTGVHEVGVSFDDLESRLHVILPEQYEKYDEIQPVSMGSAGLEYDPDGTVAWDRIWGSFCDLAMAGGPPHRGKLLEPGTKEEIDLDPERYQEVAREISRGVWMATEMFAEPSTVPGCVRMYCTSAGMAGWLTRALLTENISAGFRGLVVYLPAGPRYGVQKEIKNVICATAKACHYWLGHTSPDQQWEISQLLARMEIESPLLQPPSFTPDIQADTQRMLKRKIGDAILQCTGLRRSDTDDAGWLGLECGNVRAAVWMMRMLVVSNVLSRREGTQVFIPVNPVNDSTGERIVRIVDRVHGVSVARGVF